MRSLTILVVLCWSFFEGCTQECTEVSKVTKGFLTSPNYDEGLPYHNDVSICWRLTAAPNDVNVIIRIHATEFDTEKVFDTVTVADCGISTGRKIVDLTGNDVGEGLYFYSFSPCMQITFVSDVSTTGRGFRMYYEVVKLMVEQQRTTTMTTVVELEERPFHITSPGYPENYQAGLDTDWEMKVTNSDVIHIADIISFVTERFYDYVDVYDGERQLARLTGNLTRVPSSLLVIDGVMRLRFHTDASSERGGFEMSVAPAPVDVEACAGDGERVLLMGNGDDETTIELAQGVAYGRCRWEVKAANTTDRIGLRVLTLESARLTLYNNHDNNNEVNLRSGDEAVTSSNKATLWMDVEERKSSSAVIKVFAVSSAMSSVIAGSSSFAISLLFIAFTHLSSPFGLS